MKSRVLCSLFGAGGELGGRWISRGGLRAHHQFLLYRVTSSHESLLRLRIIRAAWGQHSAHTFPSRLPLTYSSGPFWLWLGSQFQSYNSDFFFFSVKYKFSVFENFVLRAVPSSWLSHWHVELSHKRLNREKQAQSPLLCCMVKTHTTCIFKHENVVSRKGRIFRKAECISSQETSASQIGVSTVLAENCKTLRIQLWNVALSLAALTLNESLTSA